ncbi:MAG: peptidase S8 [Anaerolineales bacterium]|nr:MAG: peptidase S8 [Anaerolineales bacterium]
MLVVTLLLSLIVVPVFADDVVPIEPLFPPPSAETGEMVDETPQLWFVELSSAPTADGTNLAALKAEKAAFRVNAKKAGLVYTERYAFDTLFNGFSISITTDQLGKLNRMAGVKNIYPVETIAMPVTTPSEPELFTSLAMIGADVAQSELGYTGMGVKVAVMDTGIDYDHQAFGGDGVARSNSTVFPTARVAYGYDLVGDAFNADSTSPSYNPVPTPDLYPDDCYGHGTHVAGIIGANDLTNGLKGVAPDVTFGSYRVFGCEGSTTADIMIAAMERALADGMQVLNMSIGSAYQWPQYPTAMAANRLVNKGMVVVASIGNNGANGLYSAGAPGVGDKVIGVASYDNTNVMLPYFTVNGWKIGYITMTFSPNPPTAGTGEIVNVGLACSALPAGSLTGKVAHAVRGTCSFAIKATNAINAGAVAVLISNNAPGVFNGTLGGPLDGITPVVGISQADGNFLNTQTAPITLTWTDQMDSFPSPTGGLISSFSSYGLSPDLALKPDLGAPGGNIYSTYPLELGGYTTMSGTSMSSPHVAGAVALLLQARPRTSSQAVRGILQNSSVPKNWWGGPTYGYLDNVHRQGAGMVQIDKAILATTMISPAKIATGEGAAGPFTQVLTLKNNGAEAVSYNLSFVNALSTGGVINPGFYTSNASVSFSATSVTVPAGASASVTATINPATGPTYGQYGGYIVFTPQGGGQVYRVPFAGFVGDYQGIQALTAGPVAEAPMPWLALLYGGSYYQLTDPTDWTFTMQGSDIPFFLVHFEHQARLFRIEIFSQNGKAWHRAYNEEYLGRNSTSTGFFAFPFDGTTLAGNKTYTVPDGTYYAKISVLKALGDASNPADWETWTSPLFVIDRP